MLELLAPAGSRQALQAAVQNGADAVYLGAGAFNARMGARNFSMEELAEAVTYCHIRGVRVYLTVNTLVTDREMERAAELLAQAAVCGVWRLLYRIWGWCPYAIRWRPAFRCTPPRR